MSKETALADLQTLSDDEATVLNSSPELLQKFKEKHGISEQPAANGIQIPDSIKSVAQAAYSPFRLTRAIGAGAERMMAGQVPPILPSMAMNPQKLASNLPQTAQTFKAALKPGYEPQEGEKIGSFLGEAGGLTAATLPLGGIGAASLPIRAAASATAAGGLTALQQASEKGRVKILPTIPKSASDLVPDSVIGNAIFGGALAGAPEAIQTFRQAAKAVALKVLPRTFAKTASIPERATQMAIQNPRLTKSIGDLEANIHDQATKVMGALQQAKAQIGQAHGQAYLKYAGLNNPMDEFIEGAGPHKYPTTDVIPAEKTPSPLLDQFGKPMPDIVKPGSAPQAATRSIPTKSMDDLRGTYKQALSGDLLKTVDPQTGNIIDLPEKDKLGVLSDLKRDIQSQINYNKEPMTLRPIDTVKDAALKKMASQVDALRDKLPNGKKLSTVDRGWQAINDIYGQLQRDLATPGKAEDTLMKLFKRDPSAITSGRTAEKLAAIRRVESITGEKVLQPLFEMFTKREFGKAVGKGLSHTLLTSGGLGGAAGAAMSGHPGAALGLLATLPLGSPMAVGAGIRGAQAAGRGMQAVANSQGARSAFIAALLANRKKESQ